MKEKYSILFVLCLSLFFTISVNAKRLPVLEKDRIEDQIKTIRKEFRLEKDLASDGDIQESNIEEDIRRSSRIRSRQEKGASLLKATLDDWAVQFKKNSSIKAVMDAGIGFGPVDDQKHRISIGFAKPVYSILWDIQQKHKCVPLHDQLFVQIAAMIQNNVTDMRYFNLLYGLLSEKEIALTARAKIARLHPTDVPDNDIAQRGQWLIQDGDQWVGLTDDGVEWHTTDEWPRRITEILRKKIEAKVEDLGKLFGLKGIQDISEEQKSAFLEYVATKEFLEKFDEQVPVRWHFNIFSAPSPNTGNKS